MINRYLLRQATDRFARGACWLATLLAVIPLFSVLFYIGARGIHGLSPAFFTELPQPVGATGGGMGNAVLGSALLVGLASLISIPIGMMAAVYLAEFGHGALARAARFSADVISGVPSITVGIFIYSLVVISMRRFSLLAGALALAVLMLPTVTRTTEEMLRMVPDSLREAGLALGLPKWKVTIFIVLRTGLGGIMTAVMLAIARAAGETAPLLFTALGNRFWSARLDQPIASLPVQIFTYAVAPFEQWHEQAWAAALVLLALVLGLNILARTIANSKGAHR